MEESSFDGVKLSSIDLAYQELSSVALGGEPIPENQTYSNFIDSIKGRFMLYNDILSNGFSLKAFEVPGNVTQDISVAVPYYDADEPELSNRVKFQAFSAHGEYVWTDEDDDGEYEITSITDIGILKGEHITPPDPNKSALYAEFTADPY